MELANTTGKVVSLQQQPCLEIKSAPIEAWAVKLEIVTDQPTNRPTDGQTESKGGFTSNKGITMIMSGN